MALINYLKTYHESGTVPVTKIEQCQIDLHIIILLDIEGKYDQERNASKAQDGFYLNIYIHTHAFIHVHMFIYTQGYLSQSIQIYFKMEEFYLVNSLMLAGQNNWDIFLEKSTIKFSTDPKY